MASLIIRNLIVDVTKDIRRKEKLSQIRLNVRRKIKAQLLLQQKMKNDVFLIEDENYLNLACDDYSWIVDLGASFHITPHEYFSHLTKVVILVR